MSHTHSDVLPRVRSGKRAHGDLRLALIMIAPAVIGLGVFLIWPTLYGIALSFTDFNLLTAPEGVGVNNYSPH